MLNRALHRAPHPGRRPRRRALLWAMAVGLPLAAIPGGNIALAILGIGFLIFIHEWGHFYACKLTGTRTETFSIGFGPRLFGWEKDRDGNRRFTTGSRQLDPDDHAMDFRVAAIPLGGYVKMAGELPGEATTGAEDEFPQKSASARAFIISAGVIMNFLVAVLFYGISYAGEKTIRPPIVGGTVPGGAAQAAGLRAGDLVLEIDGATIENRIDLLTEIAMMPRGDEVPIVVERNGKRLAPMALRGNYDEAKGMMAVGIETRSLELTIGEGDDAITVGPRQRARVQGVDVVGGAAAFRRLLALVQAGSHAIELQIGGTTHTVAPTPFADPPKELPAKIGIEAYHVPVVKAVQGAAASVFEIGDQLLELQPASGSPVLINRESSLVRAGLADAIVSVTVRRGDDRKTMPVELDGPQAVADFFAQVDLEFDSKTSRVRPVGGDRAVSYLVDDGIYALPTSPVQEAGIQDGETVLRVGERNVSSMADIIAALQNLKEGQTVDLWVDRNGERTKVPVIAKALTPLGTLKISAIEHTVKSTPQPFFSALALGFHRTIREVKNVFRTIGSLFAGRLSFQKNIAGPITLVRVSKNMAEDSMMQLIWFLAYISVMLAVLNILPIPVLDGGHLMFILIEKIKGSPLSETAMIRFQQVGLLMLLALMFFAFKNDIMRL